jgi:hypothetical protein
MEESEPTKEKGKNNHCIFGWGSIFTKTIQSTEEGGIRGSSIRDSFGFMQQEPVFVLPSV